MSDVWTIERIRELLGESDNWPQLSVDDDKVEMYLDGNRSRYSLLDEDGFAYAWVPDERLARLFAAAPAALAFCVEVIEKQTKRAEAAEADALDVRAWADAVPVEAIRRVYKSSHTADTAADRKVRQWLEKQVQP